MASAVIPGISILLLTCVLWTFSTEVATFLVKEGDGHHHTEENTVKQDSPKVKTGAYFLTYFKSALFTVYLWLVIGLNVLRNSLKKPEELQLSLSDSHYIPLKNADNQYDDWDDDSFIDHVPNGTGVQTGRKSVRFKAITEVRQLIRCRAGSNTDGGGQLNKADHHDRHQHEEDKAVQFAHTAKSIGFRDHAFLAVQCVTLWFFANYFYALAIRFNEAKTANLLSLSSSVFILFFGLIFPTPTSERVTPTKMLAVSLMISGAILAGFADSSNEATPLGLVFGILSAFLYSAYLTLIKRKSPNWTTSGVMSLLGFMGLYCVLFFWPFFIILHVMDIEPFQIPTDRGVLLMLTSTSLIGSVAADCLWLIGAYMTSTLTATIALSLTIPMAMMADWFIHSVDLGLTEILAVLPILLGFTLGALTSHWGHWDPIWAALRTLFGSGSLSKNCFSKSNKALFNRQQGDGGDQNCSLLENIDDDNTNNDNGNDIDQEVQPSITSRAS